MSDSPSARLHMILPKTLSGPIRMSVYVPV